MAGTAAERTRSTIYAVASAPGAGERAVVRASGSLAFEAVRGLCRDADGQPLAPPSRGLYEVQVDDGVGTQPALLVWMPGPGSYTREDVAEWHLVGNPALVRAVLRRLGELGLEPAGPGEFTRRAFENGRLDLTRAEGVLALVEARNREELRAAARVAGRHVAPAGDFPAAGPRVESREQLVGHQHVGSRQHLHQAALARVGVADERYGDLVVATGHLAATPTLDLLQPTFQLRNSTIDQTSVGLDLTLARTATGSDATFDAFEVSPQPFQSRPEVEQLSQLDLQFGFVGLSTSGEDVEDHFAAIHDDRLQFFFQVATLCRSQVVVEDDQLGIVRLDQLGQLDQLAAAQAGGRMRSRADLGQFVDDFDSGGRRQTTDLLQRLLAVASLTPVQDADQDPTLGLDVEFFALRFSQLQSAIAYRGG